MTSTTRTDQMTSSRRRVVIANLVRAYVAEQVNDPAAVAAVTFGSWPLEGSYVLADTGTAHYTDGYVMPLLDSIGDAAASLMVKESGEVGDGYVLGVDLRTGVVKADSDGQTVYKAFGLPVPDNA